jgi:hypothetical protein
VKYFNYLGSTTTNEARCPCKINSRISMAKAAFSKKNTLFTGKFGVNLRKKRFFTSYIWTISLYGAGTWTLWEVDQNLLESLEMCWRRSVGLIMVKMKKYYIEPREKGISYIQ